MRDEEKTKEELIRELQTIRRTLMRSEEQWKVVLEGDHKFEKMAGTIPASIFIIQDGHICYVNRYTEERSGYTRRELFAMRPWACIHPDMQEMVRRRTLSRIKGGPVPSHYEVKLVGKGGQEFVGDMSTTMITYRGKSAIMGFIYDITERKRAEERLRESESKYRALFQNASDAIFLMSGETIISCNEKALEMFGCEGDHITGKTPFDLSPSAQPGDEISANGTRVRISQALSGASQSFEWQHRRLDGTIFDAEVSLARVELDGAPFLHCTIRDITDRKIKEEALRESEHKFRDLAEKSLVGIYLIQDGVFRYVNSKFAEIMGRMTDELIETKHEETLLPEDRAQVLELLRKRTAGELPSLRHEFRIVTRKGEIRNVEVYGTRTIYRGRPAVIGTLLDVTERKEAEERLKRSEAGLRALIGSMNDIITIVNKNGRYVRIDPANPDKLFMPAGEPLQKALSDAIPGESVGPFLAAVRKALRTRRTASVEYRVDAAEGERWFSTAISPMTDVSTVCVARDITDIKMAERDLHAKSLSLEETNSALRVLLRNMEVAKKELEENVVSNIRVLVMPYIEKLSRLKLEGPERVCIEGIMTGLRDISSPFLHGLNRFNLTPTEIRIANYIRDGHTTKEIVQLMHSTKDSVDMHRYNIRRKLGMNKDKRNLRAYLLTIR